MLCDRSTSKSLEQLLRKTPRRENKNYLDSSENLIIKNLITGDCLYKSRIRAHWSKLLYINVQN